MDDVEANLVALRAVLEPLGQELVSASSGEQALKHLLDDDFAAIVMDVQMPGLDGLETARLIRSRQRTRHIPIIFVTALNREAAYVMRGYAEGGVDYLLKPIEPEILRSKVAVFVELYLRGEQLKAQAMEISRQRQLQDELQRASELEQQLVGIVGHDLRTPLSALLLTASQQLSDPELPAGQRKAFERVGRSASRMTRIVDLLLDFTRDRLGGGIPITREESDLSTTVCGVLDEARAAHPDRQLICHTPETPVTGCWDAGRLSQVISNLVGNALQYGSAGAPVVARVSENGDAATVTVHNQGEPIPPSLLPSLFEPFRRGLQQPTQGSTSLGLGLYIAAAIVRAHGGRISVRSERGFGTEFSVSIPRSQPSRDAVSQQRDAAQVA